MGASGPASSAAVADAVSRFVREVGFPVAVAAFVLWRLDAKVEDVAVAARETASILGELRNRVCVCGPPESAVPPRAGPRHGALEMGPPVRREAGEAQRGNPFRSLSLRQPIDYRGPR